MAFLGACNQTFYAATGAAAMLFSGCRERSRPGERRSLALPANGLEKSGWNRVNESTRPRLWRRLNARHPQPSSRVANYWCRHQASGRIQSACQFPAPSLRLFRGGNVAVSSFELRSRDLKCRVTLYGHPQDSRKNLCVLTPGGTLLASLRSLSFAFSDLRKALPKPKSALHQGLVLANGILFHAAGRSLGESFQTERGMRIVLRRANFADASFRRDSKRWFVEATKLASPRASFAA